MATNGARGALAPIRICDFSGQLAGAGATRFFAAFGAQVIRIEDRLSQGGWDIFRGNGPYIDERRGTNLGGMFNNHNVEKLGITLNAKSERGKEIMREIISISDVVTENFSAGVMERWGFPYEEMRRIKPDIIYVSNCGFGHRGPYTHFKTWGPVVQAVSGLTFQSGLPDMPPAGWGYSHMDHTGGYFMAIAILMALYHRNKTGEGQYVDLSCTDAALTLNGPALLDYTVNRRPMRRPGSPHSNRNVFPPMAPHGIYRSKGNDRWVAISAQNETQNGAQSARSSDSLSLQMIRGSLHSISGCSQRVRVRWTRCWRRGRWSEVIPRQWTLFRRREWRQRRFSIRRTGWTRTRTRWLGRRSQR